MRARATFAALAIPIHLMLIVRRRRWIVGARFGGPLSAAAMSGRFPSAFSARPTPAPPVEMKFLALTANAGRVARASQRTTMRDKGGRRFGLLRTWANTLGMAE